MKKMILDLDTGVDDALAISYALGSPEIELIGITGTYGNVLVEQGVRNALAVTDLLGHPEVKVYQGLPHSSTTDHFEVLPISAFIHGDNGIGDVEIPDSNRSVETESAVDFIIDAVERLREDVALVSCPVVLIDRLTQCGWCDAVGFDNYLGGRLAARYLLEGGHTRIGIVTGDTVESSAAERRRGFVDAVEQAGECFDSSLCVEGDYRFGSGYHAADQIIDGGATAVFCCNDVMALGFRQRMAERGLRVTEDMQVIGYDNILKRFGLGWRMTTVEQSVADLAAACWGMLRERIDVAIRTKSGVDSRAARPWLSNPQVEVLTPKLVQAACA